MTTLRMQTDKAVAVDCELTCWDDTPPAGQRPEIIQIGIVEADMVTLEITRRDAFLVRPRVSEVSLYCTELTRITPADVKMHGRPLGEVLRTIAKRYGTRKPWVTWGSDWGAVDRECREAGCDNPFPPQTEVNLGQFVNLLAGEDRRLGLDEAMAMAGLEQEGLPHDGLVDAGNTMRLFLRYAAEFRRHAPRLAASPK